jgi:hypothetical protein
MPIQANNSGSIMQFLTSQSQLRMRAELSVGDNGSGTVSAPVKITANSGDPVMIPNLGPVVWDFDSMSHKPRIPLDWCHDPEDSIGYLNKFDTSSGSLVCGGAIVPTDCDDDQGAEIIAKAAGGVPYEASIESWGGTLELIDTGETATVNGKTVSGPLFVLRDWTLAAVAVCKFGQDSNTETQLLIAASKNNSKRKKVLFRAMSKDINMDNEIKAVPAVEAVETIKPEVAKVETVEAEKVQLSEVKPAEVAPVATVDATKAEVEEVKEAVSVDTVTLSKTAPAVDAADTRSEFKQFLTKFGDKAADYYAKGLSFSESLELHLKSQADEIESLKNRLSAVKTRGESEPVKLSKLNDTSITEKRGLESVIKRQG